MDTTAQVTAGALAMGFAVAGLIFLRSWRETRDRLFAFFALAFFILAVNRVGTGIYPVFVERGDHLYWVRFFAFGLILLAIIDKNRTRTPPPPKPPPSG
jgi:hypothetical protein